MRKSITEKQHLSKTLLLQDVDIGNIFDDNEIPLQYCARFLVTRFLISDKSDSGRPTRVSVMSLALSCLAQIIKIHPDTGFISVVKDKEIYEGNLTELVECIPRLIFSLINLISWFVRLRQSFRSCDISRFTQ